MQRIKAAIYCLIGRSVIYNMGINFYLPNDVDIRSRGKGFALDCSFDYGNGNTIYFNGHTIGKKNATIDVPE